MDIYIYVYDYNKSKQRKACKLHARTPFPPNGPSTKRHKQNHASRTRARPSAEYPLDGAKLDPQVVGVEDLELLDAFKLLELPGGRGIGIVRREQSEHKSNRTLNHTCHRKVKALFSILGGKITRALECLHMQTRKHATRVQK